jgi:hypothetical protein
VQNKFKKIALGAFVLVVAASLAFAASGKLSSQGTNPQAIAVEDADTVKRSIVEMFTTSPGTFVLQTASRRLAEARLDGFAVCTRIDEATAAQYIEVAGLLDKAATHAPEFMQIVDLAMDSDAGMNDCDYRVISLIARVTTRG